LANNYLLFSTLIHCATEEQQDWLVAKLEAQEDEYVCEFMRQKDVEPDADERKFDVWVYTDESGEIDLLADIVCEFQKQFDLTEPWTLTYAETCSKPRLDEFCGGTIVCYKGEAYYMHAFEWAERKIKELTG